MNFRNNRIGKWIKQFFSRNEGSALVISLLIMLVLILLGLALLMQSNTEYVIAVNEKDSTSALYDAEAALQLTKEVIKTKSVGLANLTNVLNNGTDGQGILAIRSVNHSIGLQDLNDNCSPGSTTCELTQSVVVPMDNGENYEAFRIGVDRDGSGSPAGTKSGWDGPRGIVYVRVEDNHDDDPNPDDMTIDQDKRINAKIISQYPILVDATGLAIQPINFRSATQKSAGLSVRRLFARFGPSNSKPAIVTDGNMTIQGSADVCGECGAVHANNTLTIGADDVDLCSDATSTANPPILNDGGTAQIGGTVGQAAKIDVEIANPFHENYVPTIGLFDTSTDSELTGYDQLKCQPWSNTNTAAGKYFALVGDGANGRVFKAYWHPELTPPQWKWEQIDVLEDGTNTILDDCGRVVNAGGIHAADPLAGTAPNLQIADTSDNNFYGFTFGDSGQAGGACDGSKDTTLSGTANNDYGISTRLPSMPFTYMLPGTSGPKPVPNDATGKDGVADYNASLVMGNKKNEWLINGNDVYSPLYNAVIFVYGNLSILGGPTTLCSSSDTPPCSQSLPGQVWRVSFIALNNINAGGNPAYGPARTYNIPDGANFQYALISGRDLDLSGHPGHGDICPANCSDPPTHLAGYAGGIYVHEQINVTGDVAVNGVLESEDANNCSKFVNEPGMRVTGSIQVYYDCLHPPANGGESVRLQSWEEIQGSKF